MSDEPLRGVCWFCHHGWPEQIADIYETAVLVAGYSAMHFGPAHIVWEDENFARHHVQWCLDNFSKYAGDFSARELAAVAKSLSDLLRLQDSVLEPRPDYDEEIHDVRDYPPPPGMVMIDRDIYR